MSDNIDYDELDKAVNEAIKSRAAAKPAAKPVVKKTTTAPKPVVKPTTPKVAPKPVNHGHYMDFVAKRPLSAIPHPVTPVAQPVAQKPIVKRVMQPQPARPIARPAIARPDIKPVITRPIARPQQRPVITKAAAPVARPVNHSVAQQIQHKQQVVQRTKPVVAAKPVAKPVVKAVAPEPKPVIKEEAKAPNANNYSLGGRSPFMINTKVDKRPLGTNIPETTARTLQSTRNTYSQKDPSSKKHHAKKHIVTESPKSHSGWLWTFIVILVIAAGAGLGYLAYRLVFAN